MPKAKAKLTIATKKSERLHISSSHPVRIVSAYTKDWLFWHEKAEGAHDDPGLSMAFTVRWTPR
jgi:hypothetical protein